MDDFPLQDELIDAVIQFANAKLKKGDQVLDYFCSSWRPDSIPRLRTCRKIQTETRRWLTVPNEDSGFLLALLGSDFKERVDAGIRLGGQVAFRLDKLDDVNSRVKVIASWHVEKASLRSICGLAVATIHDAGLSKRIRVCDHKECANIFIDDRSRGKPRIYCKTEECASQRNRERVAASRGSRRRNSQ